MPVHPSSRTVAPGTMPYPLTAPRRVVSALTRTLASTEKWAETTTAITTSLMAAGLNAATCSIKARVVTVTTGQFNARTRTATAVHCAVGRASPSYLVIQPLIILGSVILFMVVYCCQCPESPARANSVCSPDTLIIYIRSYTASTHSLKARGARVTTRTTGIHCETPRSSRSVDSSVDGRTMGRLSNELIDDGTDHINVSANSAAILHGCRPASATASGLASNGNAASIDGEGRLEVVDKFLGPSRRVGGQDPVVRSEA